MSTKIYNGYLIDLEQPIVANLNTVLYPVTQLLRKVSISLIAAKMAEVAAEAVDRIDLDLQPYDLHYEFKDGMTAFQWADKIVREGYREIYATHHRNPSVDFQCSIHIYPIPNKVLAIVRTEQEKYYEALKVFPEFKEYGYWNNSDKPGNISHAKWGERRIDWEVAFNQRKQTECGVVPLTWELIDAFDGLPHIEPAVIYSNVPSLEERAKKLAWDICLNTHVKSIRQGDSLKPMHEIMGLIREASEFLKDTEPGRRLLKENETRIQNKIKKVHNDFRVQLYAKK